MSNITVHKPKAHGINGYVLLRDDEIIGSIVLDKNIKIPKTILAKRKLDEAFKGLTHSTCFTDEWITEPFKRILFDRTGNILSIDPLEPVLEVFDKNGVETIIQATSPVSFLKSRLPTSADDESYKAYDVLLSIFGKQESYHPHNTPVKPFVFGSAYIDPTKFKTLVRHVYNIYLALGYKEYLKGNKK